MNSKRLTILLLTLILTTAFGVRLYGVTWGLPYEYYPDEAKIVSGALRFGTGDLNPHRFDYPSLLFYLLFSLYAIYASIGLIAGYFQNVADVAVSYFIDPTMFYLIGRTFVALLGTVTVGLAGIVGTRLYNPKIGIVAACFFAFTSGHVQYSHYAVTDVPMTFFVMSSFLFAVLIYLNGKRRDYILAGIFAGLATSTKYPAAAIMVALCTAHILRGIEQKRTLRTIFLDSNIVLAFVLSVFAFIAASPFIILDFKTFNFSLSCLASQSAVGEPWREDIGTYLGVFTRFLPDGMGVVLEVLGLAGVCYSIYHWSKKELLLISFPVVYYAVMGKSPFSSTRYWIVILPFLCIFASRLFVDVIDRIFIKRKLYSIVAPLAVLLIISQSLYRSISLGYTLTQKDTRTIAKEWIEENIPPYSKIALERYSPPLKPDSESFLGTFNDEDTSEESSEFYTAHNYYKAVRKFFKSTSYSITNGKYVKMAYEQISPFTITYRLKKFSVIGIHPASFYREHKFEYVVLGFYPYLEFERYFPETAKNYVSITAEYELIKEILPQKGTGPVIEVYRLIPK